MHNHRNPRHIKGDSGWSRVISDIRSGELEINADLLVLEDVSDDPYKQLIDAKNAQIRLTTAHGVGGSRPSK